MEISGAFKKSSCCGHETDKTATNVQVRSAPGSMLNGYDNICEGTKPDWPNVNCTGLDLDQSGINVTKGYEGMLGDVGKPPITTTFFKAGLCPVNVHWHVGTEHLSVGNYDEMGTGPNGKTHAGEHELEGHPNGKVRHGYQCHHYDSADEKFTKPYVWKNCPGNMKIGETYEIHWPHSKGGACGTPNQYQSDFYGGVFCHADQIGDTWSGIGVQAQVFVLVNDEAYFYPSLMRGMIVDGEYGKDLATYTGSTTGTSRSNEMCSQFSPITWHVDRKCHLISASSFDAMCADMKFNRDDMSSDMHPHGARELVAKQFAANNQEDL